MSNQQVKLKIVLPHKTVFEQAVERVVIPAVKGNLTVLSDRAPTTMLLENGMLSVLDTSGKATKRYFIQGGVADVAGGECKVMTPKALDVNEVGKEKIRDLISERERELKSLSTSANEENVADSDIEFYRWISRWMETFAK